jgi:hypothetical protein
LTQDSNTASQRRSPRVQREKISQFSRPISNNGAGATTASIVPNASNPLLNDEESVNEDGGRKRPRTCLITDTPDHKQKSTIITSKQEKLRKRFSIQLFNTNTVPTSLPSIPDTPVKSKNNTIFYFLKPT